MNNYFDLPDEVINRIPGMSGDAVSLPFPVVYFRWENGSQTARANGSGVNYYGGWVGENQTGKALPGTFILENWRDRSGATYDAYARRYLHVAVIGKRFRFETRGHGQWLCMSAEYLKDDSGQGRFVPWGLVVLTAKGHAQIAIETAMRDWAIKSAEARIKAVEGRRPLPPHLFYVTIGTFGNERIDKTVGKQPNTAVIVPAQLKAPDTIDVAYLMRRFVGVETAETMAQYAKEAEQWLNAWKQRSSSSQLPSGDEIPF